VSVRLQNGKLQYGPYGWCGGVRVSIEVENLGYDKEVLVHFDTGEERRAKYERSLPGNWELWVWDDRCDEKGGKIGGKGTNRLKFCIKYVVNGKTYWDNNGGWDYCLQWNQPVAPAVWRWPSSPYS
jgi:hypothetical protein